MKKKSDKPFLDSMSKNRQYWKGPFYINRKDPRLIIPKLNPEFGYTLNFGSLYAYLLIGAIIAIIVAFQFIK